MQIREVPITPVPEGSNELEEEAEWIYKQAFLKPPVSKADQQDIRERSRRYCNLSHTLYFTNALVTNGIII